MKNILANLYAFANSNAATKYYVSSTAQNSVLDQAGYEALTWVEITGVGAWGETGLNTNVLTYDTISDDVTQKGKGLSDAGSPEIELVRNPSDAGQAILEAAGAVGNNNEYAFKEVRADGTNGNEGSVFYNRGIVTGPRRPQGRNEDFDLVIFTLGFNQQEISVDPLAGGNAPTLTVAPVITGTAQVGQVLTVDDGTFTGDATITYAYQWFIGGAAVSGETNNTYTPVAGDVGKVATARVVATNASGSASGFAAPTSAIIAA